MAHMSTKCDWADAQCSGGEPWTSICFGCGRKLAICDAHYGYHITYQVLGPACPSCGTRDVYFPIPDVPALTFTRVLFAWQR